MNGALLIHKHEGITSFGVLEIIQKQMMQLSGLKRRDLPKLGHGGTLDPFATGLLVVLVGRGVKLAQYFLGSEKTYEGRIRFGETTVPGDPTESVSEKCEFIPDSIETIQESANSFCFEAYLQTPPMHSAKKQNGKPLYELARQGIEVERKPKLCKILRFQILDYNKPHAHFNVSCSSGTYVRTLAQDLAKKLGSLALLETLHRTHSGIFSIEKAFTTDQILASSQSGKKWDELPCWIPFDRLLDSFPRAEATPEERQALIHGKQNILVDIIGRTSGTNSFYAIYCANELVAIARKDENLWGIERVFTV